MLGFLPILFSRSAAIDSIVRRIKGYMSSTALKCSTESENKLQYVSARTLATRRAFVNKQISVMINTLINSSKLIFVIKIITSKVGTIRQTSSYFSIDHNNVDDAFLNEIHLVADGSFLDNNVSWLIYFIL